MRSKTPHFLHIVLSVSDPESPCIRTPLAQFLDRPLALESLADGGRTLTLNDFLKGFFMHISEVDYPVRIKAAGDDRPVTKYAEMVTHSVTKYAVAHILTTFVGPFKTLSPLEVQFVSEAISSRPLAPLIIRKILTLKVEDVDIPPLVIPTVPEAKYG